MGALATERGKTSYIAEIVLYAVVTAALAVLLDALIGTSTKLRINAHSHSREIEASEDIAAWEDEGGAPPGATQ